MSELIELGIKQGAVIAYNGGISNSSREFLELEEDIKAGRCGLYERKGTSIAHLYVVLTQDCTIAADRQPIELAQLRKQKVADEGKVEHLFIGKDYSKLYLKFEGEVYEAQESLLTKVCSESLTRSLTNGTIQVQDCLPENETRILLDWRTLAYFREPYPDKFNRILTEYLYGDGAWFLDFLKDNHENIHSIRVYVSPDDIEDAEKYKFSMTALITKEGEAVEQAISDSFDAMLSQLSVDESIDWIQSEGFDTSSMTFPDDLVLSLTVSLDNFSFANAYVMREFNFQFLCY